ncbi:hypothetical protein [Nonomuraea sp. NPDC049309]|uniref:hypothetical protein n=1 Tax=Nonomuraea sp. NPDC049309 TaxID=3364350 RepID=UPI00371019BF
MRIYVETLISADIDQVWRTTQDLALHQRWDLRFGRITPLPSGHMRYSTLGISGTAVATGNRDGPGGTRTSALRFGSTHPLSPIRSGSGYWRYLPTPNGLRFLTLYDYRPRVLPGRLMWWATAWSFDRLRLWLETGLTPERALLRALAEVAVRGAAVAAAGLALPLWAALTVLAAAVLWPPLPGTPAARRCLRHRPTAEHRRATENRTTENRTTENRVAAEDRAAAEHRPTTQQRPTTEQRPDSEHRPASEHRSRLEAPCPRSSSAHSAPASTASTPSSSAASASGSTPGRPASAPA